MSSTFTTVFPTGNDVKCMSFGPAEPGAITTSTQTCDDLSVIEMGAVCTDRAGAALTSSAVIASMTTAMITSATTDLRSRCTSVASSSSSHSSQSSSDPRPFELPPPPLGAGGTDAVNATESAGVVPTSAGNDDVIDSATGTAPTVTGTAGSGAGASSSVSPAGAPLNRRFTTSRL